jgi:hypothetical protein
MLKCKNRFVQSGFKIQMSIYSTTKAARIAADVEKALSEVKEPLLAKGYSRFQFHISMEAQETWLDENNSILRYILESEYDNGKKIKDKDLPFDPAFNKLNSPAKLLEIPMKDLAAYYKKSRINDQDIIKQLSGKSPCAIIIKKPSGKRGNAIRVIVVNPAKLFYGRSKELHSKAIEKGVINPHDAAIAAFKELQSGSLTNEQRLEAENKRLKETIAKQANDMASLKEENQNHIDGSYKEWYEREHEKFIKADAKIRKLEDKRIAKQSENIYNIENDNHSLAEYEALKLENEKLRARNQKLINESNGDYSEEVEKLNSLLLQKRLKNQKLTRQVEELSKHPQVLTDTKKTFLDNKIKELLAQVAAQQATIERLEGQVESKNNSEKLYTEHEMEAIRAELAKHKADSDAKFAAQEQRITRLEAKVYKGIDLAEDGLDLARRFAKHVKDMPDLNKMGKELKEKIEEFKQE